VSEYAGELDVLPESLDDSGLSDAQREAATHPSGPLLVFAGPGAGKTRVLVHRLAHLVIHENVPPFKILAVTFTNKAAREIRARLDRTLGPSAKDLWVGTFHASCAKILRRFHKTAGLRPGFSIYDTNDQRRILRHVIRPMVTKGDDLTGLVATAHRTIGQCKQEGRGPESLDDDDFSRKVFELYEIALADANAVDFDDLLLKVLALAEGTGGGDVGMGVRRLFRHVLVDEFQDANRIQYRLAHALTLETGNLFVIADDDQSIYTWRGADPEVFRVFKRDHPSAKIAKLEKNYRSTSNIVAVSRVVVEELTEREEKDLQTDAEAGEPVRVVSCTSELDEAAFTAREIGVALAADVPANEIAVLYRVHELSRSFEHAFRLAGIPYAVVGGVRFYDRSEIKNLIAYLRLADNPRSDVDLLRILNIPARDIGNVTAEKLASLAQGFRVSVYECLAFLVENPEYGRQHLGKRGFTAIAGFYDLLSRMMAFAQTGEDFQNGGLSTPSVPPGPTLLTAWIMRETRYLEMLRAGEEGEDRVRSVRELAAAMLAFEAECAPLGERPTLRSYLTRASLESSEERRDGGARVSLMTVHAAKGLEFEEVFLAGMEEGLFPYGGFWREEGAPSGQDDEERRLAYVAITRAKKRLTITWARTRNLYGKTRGQMPSNFLTNLPPEVFQSLQCTWSAPATPAAPFAPPPEYGPSPFPLGTMVTHELFGAGPVTAGDARLVTVAFPAGERKVRPSYLRAVDAPAN